MRLLILLILTAIGCSTIAQKNLLVYYHAGSNGYVHDNRLASVEALTKMAADNQYQLKAAENPNIFHPDSLKQFDCVIFSNTNNGAFLDETQKEAFKSYIQSGGGFVGIHSASTSAPNWPWFWAMVGGKFVRHPKFQSFSLKVVDPDHPSTSFMGPTVEWTDECYFLNQINPDIHIVLAADLRTIDDEEKKNYPGDTFGNYTPLAWCHQYDGGRQFYTALGHPKEHYNNELFLKHLLGGIRWVLDEKK